MTIASEKKGRTFSFEGMLELDAPLSLGTVQLEHTDTHNEDKEGRDERECAYNALTSDVMKSSPQAAHPPRVLQIFAKGWKPW